MITRKSLADTIDAYDEQIAELNSSKRDTFDAYRNQMIDARLTKPEIKAEIEAVKAAIKRRRESVKDSMALIEKDALIDEVFAEITRAPRATRENIEKFATDGTKYDAETGVILDDAPVNGKLIKTVVHGMQTEAGRAALIAAVDIMIAREEAEEQNSPETATKSGADTDPGETAAEGICEAVTVVGPESGTVSNSETDPSEDRSEGHSLDAGSADANAGGDDVESSAPRAGNTHTLNNRLDGKIVQSVKKPLRPLCKRPENCGGYGSVHCASCMRAAKENEVAA